MIFFFSKRARARILFFYLDLGTKKSKQAHSRSSGSSREWTKRTEDGIEEKKYELQNLQIVEAQMGSEKCVLKIYFLWHTHSYAVPRTIESTARFRFSLSRSLYSNFSSTFVIFYLFLRSRIVVVRFRLLLLHCIFSQAHCKVCFA